MVDYSEVMALAVGSTGKVTAHNLSQFASTASAKPAWDAMLKRNKNMSLLLQQFGDFNPAIKDYDFAMLHLIYHDTYWESERFCIARINPRKFVAKLFASMKSGGVVAVIDHAGGEGETRDVVDKYHRINPDIVKADFLTAGFTLEGESNLLENIQDKHNINVFDASIRGKTDRSVLKFRKP